MIIASVQAGVPIFLLEYWARPRGFDGQAWYEWAWHYISYGHFAFWGIPLSALVTWAAGSDSMLATLAWYIEVLSIPELAAMGTIGFLLLRASVAYYSENKTISREEVKNVEKWYYVNIVLVISFVEVIRPGALAYT